MSYSCMDCDYCKITLPVLPSGRILITHKDRPQKLSLRCAQGNWFNCEGEEKVYFPQSLADVVNLYPQSNEFKRNFDSCEYSKNIKNLTDD